MATLAQKIETETRMRELLESSGMPQPDEVEYGFGCIRLFFHETKTVVVVDIDEDTEEAAADQAWDGRDDDTDEVECADEDDGHDGAHDGEGAEDRGPPFMTFPFPGPEQRN
jgi:hypothetical protein